MSAKRRMPNRTDAGNAELFAALYKDRVRYDHKQDRWLVWDNKLNQWNVDSERKVRLLAKQAARHRLAWAATIKDDNEIKREVAWAMQSESKPRIDAALSLAESEPPISDSGEGWDADPWLLGVGNGVLDLRTAKLRNAKPEDRITMRLPVEFHPEARCPRFEQFLSEVFGGDAERVEFIQRALGYSLTGSTNEQCIFFCHGAGANGKSTFLGVFGYVLGDYAINLPFSAFEQKRSGGVPNDAAMLFRRRFVTAVETKEGVRLNEARVKSYTGGDLITARWLYQEFFQFEPTHKLWLAFNHKPVIADDSHAMWRRVRLVPFTETFDKEQRDGKLPDKLRSEAQGILAWAVRGCLLWQKEGLGTAAAVECATNRYRDESDHLAEFIAAYCVLGEAASVSRADLWATYEQWTRESAEIPLERAAFHERLRQRGAKDERVGHERTRGWKGIGLRKGCGQADRGGQVSA